MRSASLMIPKSRRPTWTRCRAAEGGSAAIVEVPLLGWVAAGQPVDLSEYRQSVGVPRSMVRKNTYALKVRGHSMVEDNIRDGDIIVIEKRETAENGQSVVAMINGEQVTLKRFFVEQDGIRLQPANPSMLPIRLSNAEIEVLGIVTGVVRPPQPSQRSEIA